MPEIDVATSTRELMRLLRAPPQSTNALPESVLWRVYIELRRRGEPNAAEYFVGGLRQLHRRRTIGAADLPTNDTQPDEHRLAEDPYLGELWKSYKRCLCANRTGPAAQILREVEQQLQAS